METLHKPKYSWENRLSYEDREAIVNYYLQGYRVYTITKAFNTTQTTVEYHLIKKGVFKTFRQATKEGPIIKDNSIQIRALTIPVKRKLVTNIDDNEYYYDEYGNKYQQTKKSYSQYLQEAQNRVPIKRSNDLIQNKGAGYIFKPMIHIDLCTGKITTNRKVHSVLSW